MEIGKIPNELLDEIVIKSLKNKREDVLVHAGIGKDCAVVDFGEYGCVLSSDPITGAMSNIGSLAVHISCNDIAASGAEPIGVMMTMLLPPSVTKRDIEEIMGDAGKAAEELNVEIIGGHTEVTDAVNKIVLVTTVVGKQKKSEVLRNEEVVPGDLVLMTKYAGIEGTAIIANDLEEKLKGKVSEDLISEGKELAKELSVLKEGRIGGAIGAKYMHDITEGGVLGAVWETAMSNGVGIKIEEKLIPIKQSTKEIAKAVNIDPLKLISSGSMIVVMEEEKMKLYIEELDRIGVKGTVIGKITSSGMTIESDGVENEIDSPKSDEIYKVI
jgi:hydrogenase expression/formation protein HypE